jgi:hypothetical protein
VQPTAAESAACPSSRINAFSCCPTASIACMSPRGVWPICLAVHASLKISPAPEPLAQPRVRSECSGMALSRVCICGKGNLGRARAARSLLRRPRASGYYVSLPCNGRSRDVFRARKRVMGSRLHTRSALADRAKNRLGTQDLTQLTSACAVGCNSYESLQQSYFRVCARRFGARRAPSHHAL